MLDGGTYTIDPSFRSSTSWNAGRVQIPAQQIVVTLNADASPACSTSGGGFGAMPIVALLALLLRRRGR